jgi:hypothetical protein
LNNILILIENTRTNVRNNVFGISFKYKDLIPTQPKFHSSRRNVLAHRRSSTPKRIEDTMAAVVGIQHMLILETVSPVAQMEEGHYNGKLFGVACLLRKRGPCFYQRGRGRHI